MTGPRRFRVRREEPSVPSRSAPSLHPQVTHPDRYGL